MVDFVDLTLLVLRLRPFRDKIDVVHNSLDSEVRILLMSVVEGWFFGLHDRGYITISLLNSMGKGSFSGWDARVVHLAVLKMVKFFELVQAEVQFLIVFPQFMGNVGDYVGKFVYLISAFLMVLVHLFLLQSVNVILIFPYSFVSVK